MRRGHDTPEYIRPQNGQLVVYESAAQQSSKSEQSASDILYSLPRLLINKGVMMSKDGGQVTTFREQVEQLMQRMFRKGIAFQRLAPNATAEYLKNGEAEDIYNNEPSLIEATDQILKLVEELVPEEKHGKHLGHDNDENYCYNCADIIPEEELPSLGDWAWNSCRTEILKRFGV